MPELHEIARFSPNVKACLILLAKQSLSYKQRQEARALAEVDLRRDANALHKVADVHLDVMTIAVAYGFMKGRKAYREGGLDAAVAAVHDALLESLPPVLLKVLIAGGRAGLGMLQLRAAGDVEGHPFHGNQWTAGDAVHYHGTSSDKIDRILKEGIQPASVVDVREHKSPLSQPSVIAYATESFDSAEVYATMRARAEGKDPAIFELHIPPSDVKQLIEKYGKGWGFIVSEGFKPEWIKAVHTLDSRGKMQRRALVARVGAIVYAVVLMNRDEVRAAGDFPGHEFHGNQWTVSAQTPEVEAQVHAHGTVVASSKYGTVEVVRSGGRQRYLGRDRSGQSAGTYDHVHSAKDALRKPKNVQEFSSGYLRPDVAWKHPTLRTAELRALAPQREGQPHSTVGPFGLAFNVDDPRAVAWAEEHAAELAKDLSETTREDVKAAVAAALEGDGIDAAYDDILAAVGDEARAAMIARTEVMAAANEGQREGWDQAVEAGLLTGREQVEWIAASGACDDCADLDGQTRGLDGEYPDDGGEGPPLHPNCRCTEGIAG